MFDRMWSSEVVPTMAVCTPAFEPRRGNHGTIWLELSADELVRTGNSSVNFSDAVVLHLCYLFAEMILRLFNIICLQRLDQLGAVGPQLSHNTARFRNLKRGQPAGHLIQFSAKIDQPS